MSTPALGSTVFYNLTKDNVTSQNRRRSDAVSRQQYNRFTGVQFHDGSKLSEGDIYPMMVTRVFEDDSVNGQVFLDGNDVLWVKSVEEGSEPGNFSLSDDSEPVEVPSEEASTEEVTPEEPSVKEPSVETPITVPLKSTSSKTTPAKRATTKTTSAKRRS